MRCRRVYKIFPVTYFTYGKLHEIFERTQYCLLDYKSTVPSNVAKFFDELSNISLGSPKKVAKMSFPSLKFAHSAVTFNVGNWQECLWHKSVIKWHEAHKTFSKNQIFQKLEQRTPRHTTRDSGDFVRPVPFVLLETEAG
jgi:hypothetical protein